MLKMLAIAALLASNGSLINHEGGPICAPRAELVAKLAADYKEAPIWVGIVDEQRILELFVSPESWTVLVTGAKGISCIAQSGTTSETREYKDPSGKGA